MLKDVDDAKIYNSKLQMHSLFFFFIYIKKKKVSAFVT